MTFTCVFWDTDKGRFQLTWGQMGREGLGSLGEGDEASPLPASPGDWDSKGCSTECQAEKTVCRCDHLTFFALLLVTAHSSQIPAALLVPTHAYPWEGTAH